MIVVDASVLVAALGDDGDDGAIARAALSGASLAAPELLDLEVLSAWRRHASAGRMTTLRVAAALEDLDELAVWRFPHLPLVSRCWELRKNLSVYDAAYVATAELLEAPLLTADRRLAAAPGIRCEVTTIG